MATHLTVAKSETLTPTLRRVWFSSEDLSAFRESDFTDRYVKLVFPKDGVDYPEPLDMRALRGVLPPEDMPSVRTYTALFPDVEAGTLAIDFVIHGDEGIAGPWAAAAEPGDQLLVNGPGGAYRPDPVRRLASPGRGRVGAAGHHGGSRGAARGCGRTGRGARRLTRSRGRTPPSGQQPAHLGAPQRRVRRRPSGGRRTGGRVAAQDAFRRSCTARRRKSCTASGPTCSRNATSPAPTCRSPATGVAAGPRRASGSGSPNSPRSRVRVAARAGTKDVTNPDAAPAVLEIAPLYGRYDGRSTVCGGRSSGPSLARWAGAGQAHQDSTLLVLDAAPCCSRRSVTRGRVERDCQLRRPTIRRSPCGNCRPASDQPAPLRPGSSARLRGYGPVGSGGPPHGGHGDQPVDVQDARP